MEQKSHIVSGNADPQHRGMDVKGIGRHCAVVNSRNELDSSIIIQSHAETSISTRRKGLKIVLREFVSNPLNDAHLNVKEEGTDPFRVTSLVKVTTTTGILQIVFTKA